MVYLRSSITGFRLIASLLVFGILALVPAAPRAVEASATSGQFRNQVTSDDRQPLHTPFPSTSFTNPSANAVITGTATINAQGTSNADCYPTRVGAPTYVMAVDVQFGDTAGWQPANFTLFDDGCQANWNAVLSVPTMDYGPVTLRAKTTSNHGGTVFPQTIPNEITVYVDNVAPRVALNVPDTAVGNSFAVSWRATDGAGIASALVEYRMNGGAWQQLSTASSGSVSFGPSTVQPGRTFEFRARATDKSGYASEIKTAAVTNIVPASSQTLVPTGWIARQVG